MSGALGEETELRLWRVLVESAARIERERIEDPDQGKWMRIESLAIEQAKKNGLWRDSWRRLFPTKTQWLGKPDQVRDEDCAEG